jgi:hypothetical protein
MTIMFRKDCGTVLDINRSFSWRFLEEKMIEATGV